MGVFHYAGLYDNGALDLSFLFHLIISLLRNVGLMFVGLCVCFLVYVLLPFYSLTLPLMGAMLWGCFGESLVLFGLSVWL